MTARKPEASETTLTMARGWLTAHVDPYGDVARDEGASLAALLDAERERWNQEVCVALYEQSPRSADEAIDIVQALLRPATTPEPARLDADRTAQPKTEIRAAVAGHNGPVPWPGAPVSHVDRETGVRTELSAGHDAATAESGHCHDVARGCDLTGSLSCACDCDRCA